MYKFNVTVYFEGNKKTFSVKASSKKDAIKLGIQKATKFFNCLNCNLLFDSCKLS